MQYDALDHEAKTVRVGDEGVKVRSRRFRGGIPDPVGALTFELTGRRARRTTP
jgi:hypothetical protein